MIRKLSVRAVNDDDDSFLCAHSYTQINECTDNRAHDAKAE